MVDLAPHSVNHTFPVESELHTTQVLLVSLVLNELEENSPVPKVHDISLVPIVQKSSSCILMTPPSSSLVTSFDWSRLAGYRLPSYVPFQIIVKAYNMVIPSIVIDKVEFVSIMSSTTWEDLGSPHLVLVTQNLLAFNRATSQPLGIFPKLPITFGGNTIYIDVMVIEDPLDFNLLLGHDHVYVMGALVSSLLCVTCFPHEGRIVIIDKLTFIGPKSTPNKPSSLNGSYVHVVSPLL